MQRKRAGGKKKRTSMVILRCVLGEKRRKRAMVSTRRVAHSSPFHSEKKDEVESASDTHFNSYTHQKQKRLRWSVSLLQFLSSALLKLHSSVFSSLVAIDAIHQFRDLKPQRFSKTLLDQWNQEWHRNSITIEKIKEMFFCFSVWKSQRFHDKMHNSF